MAPNDFPNERSIHPRPDSSRALVLRRDLQETREIENIGTPVDDAQKIGQTPDHPSSPPGLSLTSPTAVEIARSPEQMITTAQGAYLQHHNQYRLSLVISRGLSLKDLTYDNWGFLQLPQQGKDSKAKNRLFPFRVVSNDKSLNWATQKDDGGKIFFSCWDELAMEVPSPYQQSPGLWKHFAIRTIQEAFKRLVITSYPIDVAIALLEKDDPGPTDSARWKGKLGQGKVTLAMSGRCEEFDFYDIRTDQSLLSWVQREKERRGRMEGPALKRCRKT
ncbi:hypothetical protein B0T22DRAFT_533416 [Podospora appendiculata]|uniref:Uncharacterized protein n=1 Tax=Podospora appendiculata TaxID=314037 RepID=A0AAE0XJE5_9PEZI|nr:hypothetical protein B0T22DRAFT_533416 [Podospora appendiculata]